MPRKYHINTSLLPPRFNPAGKYEMERGENCINCGRCEKACLYDVHKRRTDDPRRMAEPVSYLCKECFRCIQECPRRALTIKKSREYALMGDSYYTPDIISKNWYQAETGKIPVSGAGYMGPFSGEGFDSMWTDMSEIVRPTRDGIHGREYISTAVDIGRKLKAIKFDASGKIASPIPRTLSIPVPIIFDPLPFGRYGNIHEAMAKAASQLGTLMIANSDTWFKGDYKESLVPLLSGDASQGFKSGLIKTSKMVEIEYDRTGDISGLIKGIKRINPPVITSIRLPFGDDAEAIAETLTNAGVDVIHLYADINGRVGSKSFVKDMTLGVHRHLVDLKIRDEVTLIVSGGIAMAEHVAKAMICGADLTAIDLPLLIALECRYCKSCLNGMCCPVDLKNVEPAWGAQRIVNLIGAWRNQLLEVLGAMGLREVRRLRGEIGRAIFAENIEKETFRKAFAGGS